MKIKQKSKKKPLKTNRMMKAMKKTLTNKNKRNSKHLKQINSHQAKKI